MHILFRGEIMSYKLSTITLAVTGVLLAGVAVAADMQDQSSGNNAVDQGVINAGGFEIKPRLSMALVKPRYHCRHADSWPDVQRALFRDLHPVFRRFNR
jgi:hypothetical protein